MSGEHTIHFDPTAHSYTSGGQVLPSVTQVLDILKPASFASVPKEIMEAAGRRGTKVHKMIEDMGDSSLQQALEEPIEGLSWQEMARRKISQRTDANLVGYVNAAKKFLAESGFRTTSCEQRLHHPIYKYAGTFDRSGTLGKRGSAIIDWKTGVVTSTARLQLAAYANLLKDPLMYRRIVVKLCCDGKYKVHEYPSRETNQDFRVFLAALACYRWRLQYN